MALSIRAARHIYLESNGDEVPMEEAKLRHGGYPALVIEFEDGRVANLDPEQHLLTFDPPGVSLGITEFSDETYEGYHPDATEGEGHLTIKGATSDPHVVNLAVGFLRALNETGYRPGDVDMKTGLVP